MSRNISPSTRQTTRKAKLIFLEGQHVSIVHYYLQLICLKKKKLQQLSSPGQIVHVKSCIKTKVGKTRSRQSMESPEEKWRWPAVRRTYYTAAGGALRVGPIHPSVQYLRFSRNRKAVEPFNLVKTWRWTRITWGANVRRKGQTQRSRSPGTKM